MLIDKFEIVDVVRSTLSKIDPRLIDHGERVGYIANQILKECDDSADIDYSKLFVLCALHDIGAYKTDEIDNMVAFETDAVFEHSLYGYLLLKNTLHLHEYAEAILYHHTDYTKVSEKDTDCAKYAWLIHLADRADILMNTGTGDISSLKKFSGSKFCPCYVDGLFKAEEKNGFIEKIRNGEYRADSERLLRSIVIKKEETIDYLKLLVYAIDFRSPFTVTHTADTTKISLETGKLFGLSERDLQALYIGAFLHDIGKIAVPNSILEKPGKLTVEEFEVIKTHISEGEKILRGILSDEICDIALRHHEKLDGSGYCRGIMGSELTLSQRIVAVSDIFSALTQRRSYKEPFPKEKVIGILNDMRDKGFICPRVTNALCDNYDIILKKTEESQDPVKTLYLNMLSGYAELKEKMKNGKTY